MKLCPRAVVLWNTAAVQSGSWGFKKTHRSRKIGSGWIPEPHKLPGWRELVQRGCHSWRWSCSTRAWWRCRATRQRPSSPGTGRTRRSLPRQLAAGDVFDLRTFLTRSYYWREAISTYRWKIELCKLLVQINIPMYCLIQGGRSCAKGLR